MPLVARRTGTGELEARDRLRAELSHFKKGAHLIALALRFANQSLTVSPQSVACLLLESGLGGKHCRGE
jgi:hypothetical protein